MTASKIALPLLALTLLALAGAGVRESTGARAASTADPCAMPAGSPTWIEFGAITFWGPLAKGPIAIATSYPPETRPVFPDTIPGNAYFDLHLRNRVGTPSEPADPALIVPRANKFFDYTVGSTRCPTPYIALNELFGASTPWPWTPTIEQYRENVLVFLRQLAARGARPFLLVSTHPYTGGEAADWWREVAKVADIVREVYFPAPRIWQQGPILASRTLRTAFRKAAADLIAIGVPPSRIGFFLGFQTKRGQGGREGLEPESRWFEFVKLNALAAQQVARELKLPTVWSWGWATYSQAPDEDDADAAACVYLWARDPSLCNALDIAGDDFDTSRTEGQLVLPASVACVADGQPISRSAMARITAVTGDSEVSFSALLGRVAAREVYDPTTAQVLAAEQALIDLRFHGDRGAYSAVRSRAHASVAVARAVIADELRRAELERRLRVKAPSASQVRNYYATYAGVSARPVAVEPSAWWLGDRPTGLALGSLAPPQVFKLPAAGWRSLRTMERRYDARSLGQALPLGAIPLSTAAPAIRSALVALARDDAYDTWLGKREGALLNTTVCAHDKLPQISSVDLTTYLPFLALDAGAPTSFSARRPGRG